jgi:predicted hydrolase (HD superfamily)
MDQSGSRKTAKKTKDKAFARSVSRQDIIEGAQELGRPLEEHVEFCVKAMQARAAGLGLAGNSATSG